MKRVTPQLCEKFVRKAIESEDHFASVDNLSLYEEMMKNVKPCIVPLGSESDSDSESIPNDNMSADAPPTHETCAPPSAPPPLPPPPSPPRPSTSKSDPSLSLPTPTPAHSLTRPSSSKPSTTHQCPKCNQLFSRLCELQTHKATHQSCPNCEREFKGHFSNKNFKYHLKTCKGKKATVCPTCSKHFKQPCQLKRHSKTCHKWFTCSLCNMKIPSSMIHDCSNK